MSVPSAAARPRNGDRLSSLLLIATVAGALVTVLSPLGAVRQLALVLAIGLGVPALLLFLIRPHTALATYLLLLPLVMPWPIAAGLNAGEVLTLAILILGALGLWESRDRVPAALAALSSILWPLAGLAVVSLLSLLANGILALEDIASALFKMVAFAIVAILVHVHASALPRARTLLHGLLAGGAAVALYAVVAYAMGWSYTEEFDWNRSTGTFENWNQLGGFMALLAPATLGLAATSRRWSMRALLGGIFVLEIVALLLSLTLGSMLGLVLGGIFTLMFVVRIGWRRILPTLSLALMGFLVVFAVNPLLRDKIMRFDERVMDRLMTYAVGVQMFRDKFWLGFGSEQQLVDALTFGEADYGITIFGESSMVPHNSFLKIGVEKGILGVVLFTLLIVGVGRILLRHRRAFAESSWAPLYAGVVAGVVAFLVQNMTNDLILHARIGIIFFALIAIMDQLARTRPAGNI